VQVSGHVKRGDGAHSELRWIYVFATWTKNQLLLDKAGNTSASFNSRVLANPDRTPVRDIMSGLAVIFPQLEKLSCPGRYSR